MALSGDIDTFCKSDNRTKHVNTLLDIKSRTERSQSTYSNNRPKDNVTLPRRVAIVSIAKAPELQNLQYR